MNIVERMKNGEKISIGMVHTLPLPGSFHGGYTLEEVTQRALADARTLEQAGFDALIVENVSDGPFLPQGISTRQLVSLALITKEVRKAVDIAVGIDVCGRQSAGIEIASLLNGVDFIRFSSLVDVRVGADGITEPSGAQVVWLRKLIGAEHVKILADIQVKHTYGLQESIAIEDSARWAMTTGCDALIVTGLSTGLETSAETMSRVKKVSSVPVIAGSGVSVKNVKEQYDVCDGAIIGSSLKKEGNLLHPVDLKLAEAFMKKAKER